MSLLENLAMYSLHNNFVPTTTLVLAITSILVRASAFHVLVVLALAMVLVLVLVLFWFSGSGSGSGSGSSSSSSSGYSSSGSSGSAYPPGKWPGGPLKAMYNIDSTNPNDFKQMADAGYNLIVLAFHVSGQPRYAASAWKGFGASTQQDVLNYAHAKNAKIIVSAGGAEDAPYGSCSGHDYGTKVANFAVQNHLDGVDFDLENFGGNFQAGGMSTANTVKWVADATNAARAILGPNAVITHAPQSPYFGTNHGWQDGYGQVYKAAPSIDFLMIQYYNNDNGATDYNTLFVSDQGGSISEIARSGIPINKLIVGKPVNTADGNGYVALNTLKGYFAQAKTQFGWNGGIMGWCWHDPNTNSRWIQNLF
eukprot:Phypoly_transcript_08245.p1 GENE.Phypoly_transcript_08245~~Phypoly_transcript_08245.p1  ORF type:complete len:366 (+),score=70.16 Phypoly_transcript_08245:359-1456(+)